MHASTDIAMIRREAVHKTAPAQRAGTRGASAQPADAHLLRELLDEAHARIRVLEKAIERLTAAA